MDSSQSPGLFSKKLGESRMSFFSFGDVDFAKGYNHIFSVNLMTLL
ncbi:transcriptional activator NhaR [Vibrio cholerae]|nr:transcriptional activator NhaR [Vibrio cholerae]